MAITVRTNPPVTRSRVASIIGFCVFALWIGGLTAGLAGAATPGLILRLMGIVGAAGITLRRSSLLSWTLLAMLAGIELGIDAPHAAAQTRFLGDLFLRLIRMIVAPLLFATITTGIAGHGQLKSVGRVAVKALVLFEVVTTLGLIIGVVAMNLSGAGWGVVIPEGLGGTAPAAQAPQTWQQIVLNLFPDNIAQAVAQNQILQVAVFSILFGAALAMLAEEKRGPLVKVLQSLADVMF